MTDEKLKQICELEKELSYLVNDSMTLEEKLKSLSDAYWEASHSGSVSYTHLNAESAFLAITTIPDVYLSSLPTALKTKL